MILVAEKIVVFIYGFPILGVTTHQIEEYAQRANLDGIAVCLPSGP
jgi:hypothetical protein